MKSKILKIAIVVIDGNDVSGEHRKHCGYPSPSVHPAIQAFLEGLGQQEDLDCTVFFGAASPCDALQENLPSLRWQPVPYRPAPIPGMGAALLGRFLAVRKAVRDWKPDVVHGQGTEREAGLVAAFSGFPSVLTLHGNFRAIEKVFHARPFNYYWVAARLETLVLSRVNHVICISEYVRELLSPFSCEKTVIPNPVGSKFLGHPRPGRSASPRVACMGTIDARKNTQFILNACEKLWSEGLFFTFHVYGNAGYDSDYSNAFFSMLAPHESAGRAKFEGFVTNPAETLACADIMVSASTEESFGMNLLEAMAVGTPCIAPNLGGMRDIIAHNITGYLYEPGNLEQCAKYIRQLLNDPKLWCKFSNDSRARARIHFTPENVARSTLALYESVLRKRGKN